MDGTDISDSIAYCPQKMGGAPLQCALFLTKHKGLLLECNQAGAGYVFPKQKHYDVSFDPGDKSVQCGKKVLIPISLSLSFVKTSLKNSCIGRWFQIMAHAKSTWHSWF